MVKTSQNLSAKLKFDPPSGNINPPSGGFDTGIANPPSGFKSERITVD